MKKLLAFSALILIVGCTAKETNVAKPIGMANPASVYCEKLGGTSEITDTAQGQVGICALPSGEKIEEWALYRRDQQ
ncbi:putative hemolysin [Providencia rettgeri]|uniref:putative hemolysin n=1 Tax=Providencia sp. TaxID=589 RepID=UPI0024AC7366|nr:DUF333 domain-containing protein [Providencia rettgeri]